MSHKEHITELVDKINSLSLSRTSKPWICLIIQLDHILKCVLQCSASGNVWYLYLLQNLWYKLFTVRFYLKTDGMKIFTQRCKQIPRFT